MATNMRLILAFILSALSAQAQVSINNGPISAFYGMTNVNAASNYWAVDATDRFLCALASSVGTTNGIADITSNSPPSFPGGHACGATLVANGWSVKCDGPLITQDTTFTVNVDGTWKLTVAAHGSGTIYQWQSLDPNTGDWADVGGETTTTLNNPNKTNPALDPATSYLYRCAVTRGGRTVYSSQALSTSPLITNQPTGNTVVAGGVFGATVSGYYDTLQWTKNGVTVAGATNDIFEILNVQAGDAATYRVVLSTSNGAHVTSDDAVLTVN